MSEIKHAVLTDEEIDEAQEAAYRALSAQGYNGGMGGFQWDRASARAIERAVLDKLIERIAQLQLPFPGNYADQSEAFIDGYETARRDVAAAIGEMDHD